MLAALIGGVLVLAGCPNGPQRNPRASQTQYQLGFDYFGRARKAQRIAVRERFLNISLLETQKALRLDPQNHDAHFLISLIYMYRAQRAIEEVEVLQCLSGNSESRHRKEINGLMRKAKQHLLRAFDLSKRKDSRIALNLSTVYLHFHDFPKAEAYSRLALENIAYPTPHLARCNVGRALFQQGKHRRASKNLKQAVFSQPRFCPGYYWLGRVEFARKNFKEAMDRFERSLQCCSKEKVAPIQEAQLYLGLAALRTGQSDRGVAALKACVAQSPRSCVALRCRRNLQTAKGSSP